MIKPNIFLVGVQKAGTTSLYHYLRVHPDIYGPEIKDYNNSHPFFSNEDYFRNNKADFEKLFSENDKKERVITSDVDLIEDKNCLIRIKQYNPEAKIIISLRNPIERLRSMYNFYNQIGKNPNHYEFEEALINYSELYVSRSLYFEKIKNLYEVFDKEQIKIVYFENITGKKFNEVIDDLYAFITVDKIEKPFIHENKTRKLRLKFIDVLLKIGRGSKLRRFIVHRVLDPFFNANKRAGFKKKINEWNLAEDHKEKFELKVPETMHSLIIEDVKALSKLLNNDLLKFWSLEQ